MKRTAAIGLACSAVVLAVFTAGFFHGGSSPEPELCKPAPALAGKLTCDQPVAGFKSLPSAPKESREPAAGGFLALTGGPAYRRAADLLLKVADCTKAEDDLEAKLVSLRGEILDMVMEGTEGSRTCTLSVVIPADTFRAFINDLRKMGKVQAERITASKLKPGGSAGAAGSESPDPRELSLVSIRMADEKVAQSVLESRGVLASSFDRSLAHFMKGLAVLVELFGYVLPFALALAAVLLPVAVIVRIRRARACPLRN